MYSNQRVAPVLAATTAGAVLPNTGVVANNAVALAAAVAVGLLTWGVMYARANR